MVKLVKADKPLAQLPVKYIIRHGVHFRVICETGVGSAVVRVMWCGVVWCGVRKSIRVKMRMMSSWFNFCLATWYKSTGPKQLSKMPCAVYPNMPSHISHPG